MVEVLRVLQYYIVYLIASIHCTSYELNELYISREFPQITVY